jgi:hypothetical protein
MQVNGGQVLQIGSFTNLSLVTLVSLDRIDILDKRFASLFLSQKGYIIVAKKGGQREVIY